MWKKVNSMNEAVEPDYFIQEALFCQEEVKKAVKKGQHLSVIHVFYEKPVYKKMEPPRP